MNQEDYSQNLNIGITQGDLNGVSYELVINTLLKDDMRYSTPVFFGTPKLVSYFRKICKANHFNFNLVKDKKITNNKPNLVNIYSKEVKVNIGNVSEEAAELAVMSLDNVYEYAKNGFLDSIVCCPITKGLINTILPDFISNSHYLATKFKVQNSLKLYCNDFVKITALDNNAHFKDLNDVIQEDNIFNKITHLNNILKYDFKISLPKIAVIALNGVSNNGTFDAKEEHIIAKAIEKAVNNNIYVYGPYDAKQLFLENEYAAFDAIITMREQQAITIFTLLEGINGYVYTAGLPFVVTEPFHDSMYKIAGQNVASLEGFSNAMFASYKLTLNKKESKELLSNSLPISDKSSVKIQEQD